MAELERKGPKIRDLVLYKTGVLPLEVEIGRDKVTVVVARKDLTRTGRTESDLQGAAEAVVPRKVEIKVRD